MSAIATRNRILMAAGLSVVAALVASPLFAQNRQDPKQAVAVLLIPAFVLAGGALQSVLAVLFPRWTALARAAIDERRGVCLAWGFLIWLMAFSIVVAASAIAEWLGGIALILVLVAGLMSVFGYAGVAAAFGARLIASDTAGEDRAPLQALVGGLTLCFSCLVPIIGWLLGLLICVASVGAAAIALFRRPAASP